MRLNVTNKWRNAGPLLSTHTGLLIESEEEGEHLCSSDHLQLNMLCHFFKVLPGDVTASDGHVGSPTLLNNWSCVQMTSSSADLPLTAD